MIRNVHERVINAPIEPLGALLDGLGQKDDRLWPSQGWTPMVLDRPLALGADGGHGAIRYYVSEYEPGRRVRFTFRPRTGIIGAHELSLDALDDERTRIRHVLIGRTRGAMRLMFSAVVEPPARRRRRGPLRQRRAGGDRFGDPAPRPGVRGYACCAASR